MFFILVTMDCERNSYVIRTVISVKSIQLSGSDPNFACFSDRANNPKQTNKQTNKYLDFITFCYCF